jgi:chromosome segregation ATPase
MSRISDTRSRTREAAARLVSAGRQTHQETVDLIYAEIRQGSRTTINDELKLWKDEQTKVHALRAALPKPVADAMLTAWAAAVEHGEKAFAKRSEEIELELAQAQDRTRELETKLADLQNRNAALQGELDHCKRELDSIRQDASSERDAKENAQARLDALEKEVVAAREGAEKIVLEVKLECQERIQALTGKLSAEEEKFRAGMIRATEQLETVRKQVLEQVSVAQRSKEEAQLHLEIAQQESAQLKAGIMKLRTDLAVQLELSEQISRVNAKNESNLERLSTERDSIVRALADASGKLSAQAAQIKALEHREMKRQAKRRKSTQLHRKSCRCSEMSCEVPLEEIPHGII